MSMITKSPFKSYVIYNIYANMYMLYIHIYIYICYTYIYTETIELVCIRFIVSFTIVTSSMISMQSSSSSSSKITSSSSSKTSSLSSSSCHNPHHYHHHRHHHLYIHIPTNLIKLCFSLRMIFHISTRTSYRCYTYT